MAGQAADQLVRAVGAVAPLRDEDLLGPDQPLRPYPPVHRWRYNGLVRGLLFGLLVLAVFVVAGLVLGVVLWLTGYTDIQTIDRAGRRWGNVMSIPFMVAAYLLLVCWIEQRRPYELRLRGWAGMLGRGLAIGAVLQLACVAALAVAGAYRVQGLDLDFNPVWFVASAGFGAAITEEIVFRGVLYRILEGTFGTWAAVGTSGLVFGLVHLGNQQGTLQGGLAIALEAGLLFAALYALTRSLWLVMGVHFAWNVVQGPVLGIVVSGNPLDHRGYLRSTLTGPEWLTGGTFGMEASLVTVVLLSAVAVWLLVQVHRRGLAVSPFWVRRRQLLARSATAVPAQPGLDQAQPAAAPAQPAPEDGPSA